MKEFKSARNTYENTTIPPELNSVVQAAVKASYKKPKGEHTMKKKKILKFGITAAAAIILTFMLGLNTSRTFAMELQELPIIGPLAKLLTIRTYETIDENQSTNVKIPAIVEDPASSETAETLPSEASNRITDINAEIERICDEYVKEATIRAEEYKTAFLETGGTEEEWLEHDIKINVDYEIKSETADTLSFILYGTESWTGAYAQAHYYNLNLKTGKTITLEEILGSDYIEIANKSILSQMETRLSADENLSYFDEDMGGFTTISDSTNFYINEAGNPVIVFEKYEIAPGAFGAQEFEIA